MYRYIGYLGRRGTRQNEELHDLYSSQSINTSRIIKSRKMRWGRACSTDGVEEGHVKAVGGKARWKEAARKIKT
jgi:hypothetical protein